MIKLGIVYTIEHLSNKVRFDFHPRMKCDPKTREVDFKSEGKAAFFESRRTVTLEPNANESYILLNH